MYPQRGCCPSVQPLGSLGPLGWEEHSFLAGPAAWAPGPPPASTPGAGGTFLSPFLKIRCSAAFSSPGQPFLVPHPLLVADSEGQGLYRSQSWRHSLVTREEGGVGGAGIWRQRDITTAKCSQSQRRLFLGMVPVASSGRQKAGM